MMVLVNDKDIMGKHTNGRVANVIGWGTASILCGLSLYLVGTSLLG